MVGGRPGFPFTGTHVRLRRIGCAPEGRPMPLHSSIPRQANFSVLFHWASATSAILLVMALWAAPSKAAPEQPPAPPDWALEGFVAALDDATPGMFLEQGNLGSRIAFWSALK